MKRELFFGLALLFVGLLAFTPAKAIAQAVGGPDQVTRPQLDRSSKHEAANRSARSGYRNRR